MARAEYVPNYVAVAESNQVSDEGYRPAPAARWWKLDGDEREHAIIRLRAWVEQVYQARLRAPRRCRCWEQHPLCLYGLDWLMKLWSVLYTRTAMS